MKKVALLINVNNIHKKQTRLVVDSYLKNSEYIDIFFLYDDQNQREMFSKVDLPCIINGNKLLFKTFDAMQQLLDKYNYFIVLNVDTMLLKLENINEICDRFCNKKELYGNIKENDTNKDCAELLQIDINTEILFRNSQVPIYDSSILPHFFYYLQKRQRKNNKEFKNLDDSVLYYYYCCKFYGYKIVDLNKVCDVNVFNSLENRMSVAIRTILDTKNIEINWQTLNNLTLFHYLDDQILFIYNIEMSLNPKTKPKYQVFKLEAFNKLKEIYC